MVWLDVMWTIAGDVLGYIASSDVELCPVLLSGWVTFLVAKV